MGKFVIILLGIGSLISVWVILFIVFFGADQTDVQLSVDTDAGRANIEPLVSGRQVITTWGAAELSAAPLLTHPDTEVVIPGEFYRNSAESARYEIYFDELSGSITILLGENPIGLARVLAEQQLQQVLNLNPSELCDLRIRVAVNSAVNAEYSRQNNLGLSFCPGAVALP